MECDYGVAADSIAATLGGECEPGVMLCVRQGLWQKAQKCWFLLQIALTMASPYSVHYGPA